MEIGNRNNNKKECHKNRRLKWKAGKIIVVESRKGSLNGLNTDQEGLRKEREELRERVKSGIIKEVYG